MSEPNEVVSSDYFNALVGNNVSPRPRSLQGMRFEATFEGVNLNSLLKQLEGNVGIRAVNWSANKVYIELQKKQTVSYLKNMYPALEVVELVSECSIPEGAILGRSGISSAPRKTSCPAGKSNENYPHLATYYEETRKTGRPPNMVGNIDYILNTAQYEKVANAAILEYQKDNHPIELVPWHKKVKVLFFSW